MKKLINIALAIFLGGIVTTSIASADVKKGEKLYSLKLKTKCKKSASEFASKHSQKDWERIYDAGKLGVEIKKICNGHTLGEKELPHIYDFAYHNASDSKKALNR